MAKISIKPSQARNAVQQEAALASRLQSLESQVRSIRNGLRYKIAAREHIKSQLKAAEDQIRLERTRVTGMRNTLEQVINLYTRTENSATGSLKPKKPASGVEQCLLQLLVSATSEMNQSCLWQLQMKLTAQSELLMKL